MTATARISVYRFDPTRTDQADLRHQKRAIWADALREEPGYLGELSMDTEDGRQIVIHLWESAEVADAASVRNNPRLRAIVKEHFEPDYDTLWLVPPEHVMATVLTNTIARSRRRL